MTGDSAVIRLDVVGPIPSLAQIPRVALSQAEITRLIDEILASFTEESPLPIAGFTATDAFFPAKERFNLFNTCNVWLGKVLRAAGLPFGRWTPFPQSIRLSLARAKLAAP